MDHIKQYDWCSSEPDIYFLNEIDIDNSVTERILRNKFHDPLISSDSEDERGCKIKINWNDIFSEKNMEKSYRIVVPGIHPPPPFPKLSSLTAQQHYQCLKVLCAEQPHILPAEFLPRPTKQDRKTFEDLKETYAKEQQEFKEWAKFLWTSSHCVRALRPKPAIETVYEAEFKLAAHKVQSLPKNYSVAAQIPLLTANAACAMVHEKDLINVNVTTLPKINIPDMSEKVFILRPYPVPEPCSKHPCRFVMPGESTMSILPLTEIQTELAQYAADNGAQYIASEEALRCLMELDAHWLLAVSVCQVIGPEGATNAIVLDGPVAARRDSAARRTLLALRRLLLHALAPPVENSGKRRRTDSIGRPDSKPSVSREPDSSDDDDHLCIDTDAFDDSPMTTEDAGGGRSVPNKVKKGKSEDSSSRKRNSVDNASKMDFFTCTCKDSLDKPPQRSYKKWKIVNWNTNDKYSMIVHCPHSVRHQTCEMVLEAIPEYQIDVAASQPTPHAARSQALALKLRRHASVLNVRIDSPSGEIVTAESVSLEDVLANNAGVAEDVANRLHTALDQLQGLLPGRYILQHEPVHGDNALLLKVSSAEGATLTLRDAAAATDEPAALRLPPVLTPALLPIHKFRKILPCAFTPFPNMLTKETKKPVTRQKTPPQAIKLGETPGDGSRGKWPKKKNKKKKKNNNNNNNGA